MSIYPNPNPTSLRQQAAALLNFIAICGIMLSALSGVPAYGQDALESTESAPSIALPTSEVTAPTASETQAIPTKNILQMIKDGGLLMIPIGVCSFILFVFVFERFISLRRARVIPKPFVNRFLEQLQEGQIDREEALELC
ncbi:MAG: hypothetical protein ACI9G1_005418, partial [Pirellulaceae bacterium]